jgi:hypothetical protein
MEIGGEANEAVLNNIHKKKKSKKIPLLKGMQACSIFSF